VLRNKRGRGPQRDRGRQAGFAERLNQAEGYINERLAARGETWQLDSATRKQLGLGCHRARIIDERLVGFELGASPFFAGERMFCQLALCDLQTVCIEQFSPPRRPVTIPNDIGKILDDERVAHGDAANVLWLIRLFRQFDAPRADDEL